MENTKIRKTNTKIIASKVAIEDRIVLFVDYVLSGQNRMEFAEGKSVWYIDNDGEKTNIGLSTQLLIDILNSLGKINYDETNFGNLSRYYLDKFLEIRKQVYEKATIIFNGIKSEGVNRPFDIVDYYMYIDMAPQTLYVCLNSFGESAMVREFAKIFRSNKSVENDFYRFENYTCFSEKEKLIREATYYVNQEKISDELKEDMINFIKGIGAPVSNKLFNRVRDRYMSGDLDIYSKPYEYHK